MSFFYKALKRYHNSADHDDSAACDEAREDALHFLAMMPSTQQPRLHAALVSGFRRIPNRLRCTLSLQR